MRWKMVLFGLAAAVVAAALVLVGGRTAPAALGGDRGHGAQAGATGAAGAEAAAPHPGPQATALPGPQAQVAGAGQPAAEQEEGPHGPQPLSENAKLRRSYPITMDRLERYVLAVAELRRAGDRDPALMAKLRAPRPPDEEPSGMAARLERIGPLKAILDRHALGGMDLVLLPQVVLASQEARGLEQEGRPLAPEQVNPGGVALWRDHVERTDQLTKAFLADLKAIRGR